MPLPPTFVPGFHKEEWVRRMEYRPFGATNLQVSKISLGGGTWADFYGNYEEAHAIETIREAIRRGVNYIDTAPYYGQGRSEELIGKALKGVPREAYYIATKVGRYDPVGTFTQFDFSAAKTHASVKKSLGLLGLDYVDVIQIHDVEFAESLDEVINDCLPALKEIKRQGKARFIGVTGYPLSKLKEAILKAPGSFDSVLAYSRYTLIDDELCKYVSFFQEQRLGLVCAAGHALRLLTNVGPCEWHLATDETKSICKQAGDYCAKNGVELAKLAMWYFIQLKEAATFLVGVQNMKQLEMNLDVYYNGLTEQERKVLLEIKEKFFSKLTIRNWEGIEVAGYRELMKTKPSN